MTISKQFDYPAEKHYIIVTNIAQKAANVSDTDSNNGEKIAIVIPTLNERENIILLVPQIEEVFNKHGINGHIIIVDDRSTDGTSDAAKQLARTYRNITVIERPGKLGLGSAYRCGFKHALAMNMDIIFQMDADLSHRPKYIPDFLNALKTSDADLVIGSRYIEHGSSTKWPFQRKMISFIANLMTKMVLGASGIQDNTGGFRAFREQVLRDIDYDRLYANGFAFQIEILHRTTLAGYKVKEIPIVFHDRKVGRSKIGGKDIEEYIVFFFRALFIRAKNLVTADIFNKFVKFCIVGFIGLLLVLGIGYLTRIFTQDNVIYVITNAFATILAMLFNFMFNKIWTFRDKQGAIKRQLPLDLFGRTISFLCNEIIVIALVNQYILFAIIGGIIVQIVFNFIWNKLIVFKSLNVLLTT